VGDWRVDTVHHHRDGRLADAEGGAPRRPSGVRRTMDLDRQRQPPL